MSGPHPQAGFNGIYKFEYDERHLQGSRKFPLSNPQRAEYYSVLSFQRRLMELLREDSQLKMLPARLRPGNEAAYIYDEYVATKEQFETFKREDYIHSWQLGWQLTVIEEKFREMDVTLNRVYSFDPLKPTNRRQQG